MRVADRITGLPPYLFAGINQRIATKRAQGSDVISLGAGDPDLPPPKYIVDRLEEAARQPANHRYPPYEGIPELRAAIAAWYSTRFRVQLDPDANVVTLVGSKEGLAHVSLAVLDPGDLALLPDPGYPTYQFSTALAGGNSYSVPLLEDDGYLPRLDDIPEEVARAAKLLWLNYPNNPTSAVASHEFFGRVVAFARKHNLAVLHDNAYSDIAFDGYVPASFLEVPGAMDVGIEFHSLSKTYNMPGWRVGMAVGNKTLVEALKRLKSNIDSGIFLPVQWAAVAALRGPQDWLSERNRIYQRRRDLVVTQLRRLGYSVAQPKASLYVWARVPGSELSADFSLRVLDHADVWVTPGASYGVHGEGYFRVSLTVPEDRLSEAMRRMASL